MPSHRILYAGDELSLPARLRDGLSGFNCFVVHAPAAAARTFIRSDIKYTLLIFDETEAGAELERLTRTLAHREQTPSCSLKSQKALTGSLSLSGGDSAPSAHPDC